MASFRSGTSSPGYRAVRAPGAQGSLPVRTAAAGHLPVGRWSGAGGVPEGCWSGARHEVICGGHVSAAAEVLFVEGADGVRGVAARQAAAHEIALPAGGFCAGAEGGCARRSAEAASGVTARPQGRSESEGRGVREVPRMVV